MPDIKIKILLTHKRSQNSLCPLPNMIIRNNQSNLLLLRHMLFKLLSLNIRRRNSLCSFLDVVLGKTEAYLSVLIDFLVKMLVGDVGSANSVGSFFYVVLWDVKNHSSVILVIVLKMFLLNVRCSNSFSPLLLVIIWHFKLHLLHLFLFLINRRSHSNKPCANSHLCPLLLEISLWQLNHDLPSFWVILCMLPLIFLIFIVIWLSKYVRSSDSICMSSLVVLR